MIQLIIEGKEIFVSEAAKEWLLNEFLGGNEGNFNCKGVSGEVKATIKYIPLTNQGEMF